MLSAYYTLNSDVYQIGRVGVIKHIPIFAIDSPALLQNLLKAGAQIAVFLLLQGLLDVEFDIGVGLCEHGVGGEPGALWGGVLLGCGLAAGLTAEDVLGVLVGCGVFPVHLDNDALHIL